MITNKMLNNLLRGGVYVNPLTGYQTANGYHDVFAAI